MILSLIAPVNFRDLFGCIGFAVRKDTNFHLATHTELIRIVAAIQETLQWNDAKRAR
jgi:hypothetical protein